MQDIFRWVLFLFAVFAYVIYRMNPFFNTNQNLGFGSSHSLCYCGPVHICSRYTTPAKCSRNKFSVHEHSDFEHCEMFSVPLRSDLKSAHISVCAVWLILYTLRNVWGHFNVHSISVLIAVCVLSPTHLEHVLGFTLSDFVSEAY